MTKNKKWTLRTAAAAAFLAALGVAEAGAVNSNPAKLDIEVTVTSNLSVKIDGVAESTVTVAWNAANPNQALVGPSSATVTNDSGAQTEKWQLTASTNSIDQGTSGAWANANSTTSVGTDQFGVQAVFGSSQTAASGCPAAAAADWTNGTVAPALDSSSAYAYTNSQLADPNLNANGTPDPDDSPNPGDMSAGSKRALCWQVVTPSSVDTLDNQTIQLIVTAEAP